MTPHTRAPLDDLQTMRAFCNRICKIAFSIPEPNIWTPQIVEMATSLEAYILSCSIPTAKPGDGQ